MASRKRSMVMTSDPYVDRRIKIFKLKRPGPKVDVKRIAAELRAEIPERIVIPLTQLNTPPPLARSAINSKQPTKSSFINSIKIRATSVPVRPEVKRPSTPVECTTILDSSDEEDHDLSITCNIHVKALLSHDQHHSFFVPVNIPYKSPPKPQPPQRTPQSTPPLSPLKASYSAQSVPKRFDCFVKLERLSDGRTQDVADRDTINVITHPLEPKREIGVVQDVPEENHSHSEPVDQPTVSMEVEVINVKLEPEHNADPNIPDTPAEQTITPIVPTVIDQPVETPAERINKVNSVCIRQSIESSFDIKVEHSLAIPTIDTPPPDPCLQRIHESHGTHANVTKDAATVIRRFVPILPKTYRVSPPLLTPGNEVPPPILLEPELQQPPQQRPVIKLRNINELLEHRNRVYIPHMIPGQSLPQSACNGGSMSVQVAAPSPQYHYQQQPSQVASNHQMVPSMVSNSPNAYHQHNPIQQQQQQQQHHQQQAINQYHRSTMVQQQLQMNRQYLQQNYPLPLDHIRQQQQQVQQRPQNQNLTAIQQQHPLLYQRIQTSNTIPAQGMTLQMNQQAQHQTMLNSNNSMSHHGGHQQPMQYVSQQQQQQPTNPLQQMQRTIHYRYDQSNFFDMMRTIPGGARDM